MKRFAVLLFTFLAALHATAALAEYIPLIVKDGDSVSICAGQYYEIEYDGQIEKEMEWSSSDDNVLWVTKSLGKYVIIAAGHGSAYLNGKAADGSDDKAKVKITVPKVYTTHDKIVIDSPDGVEFGYAINLSGYNQVSVSGNCFTSERMPDKGEITMSRIMPAKVGTGSIIFGNNGKTIKTVRIEVKKSAFEEKNEENKDAPAEGEAVAVVKKTVNIRSKANADSKRIGSAISGEKLTVTKAFYSDKWHQILYEGQVCYVSANYCDIEYIESSATPVQVRETPEPKVETPIQISEAVITKLDQYIDEFRLMEECKTVLIEYLPGIEDLDRIEPDGMYAYKIILNNGSVYCLSVLQNKYPACLQSSENDYKARTRYYDRYVEIGSSEGCIAETLYVGNKITKMFHCDNCPHVITIKSRIEFSSKEEAMEKKYTPCVKCNP